MYLVSTFKLSSLLSVNYLIPHSVIYNSKRTLESKKVLLVIHRDNGYKLELLRQSRIYSHSSYS